MNFHVVTPSYASDSARWRAVKSRDLEAHWSFIYGVTSTKIYCRPTCNARLARRANVCYFNNINTAEQAGFRACARCKPNDPTFIGQRDEIVVRTLSLLQNNDGNDLLKNGVTGLAKRVGVSTSYLCRAFKSTLGMSVGTYLTEFERGPNDYDGTPIVPSTGYVADPAMHFAPPLSQINVTASECSPMSRSSPTSSTAETNSSVTNTANTTPSGSDHGFSKGTQMADQCVGDAGTQAPLYDLGLAKDSSAVPMVTTPDHRQESAVKYTTIAPKINTDPLALDFDFDDPIWDQLAAPLPAVPT